MNNNPEMVERVARAMAEADGLRDNAPISDVYPWFRHANIAIAAMPTPEAASDSRGQFEAAWRREMGSGIIDRLREVGNLHQGHKDWALWGWQAASQPRVGELPAYNKITSGKLEWVKCPICDESDMRCEHEKNGENKYILCANANCGSNGGTNFAALSTPAPKTGENSEKVHNEFNTPTALNLSEEQLTDLLKWSNHEWFNDYSGTLNCHQYQARALLAHQAGKGAV